MSSDIADKILSAKPGLAKLLSEQGQTSIADYVKNRNANLPIQPERKNELIAVITQQVKNLLPSTVAELTQLQLEKNYYANTTDHLGPLAHPFFLGGNMADAIVNKSHDQSVVINLACAGVSLNNSSLPRALLFHDKNLEAMRLRFFSLKHRHVTVYAAPNIEEDVINKLTNDITKFKLTPTAKEKLSLAFKNSFGLPEVRGVNSYSEQLTRANYHLWQQIPGQEQTALVYLDLEKITSQLIIKHHLQSTTPIQKIILDHRAHDFFYKYFNNIPSAFSSITHKGTFLFWGLNKKGEHIHLNLDGNYLTSTDEQIKIHIDAASIAQGLELKQLMPSLALCLIILNSYYGLTCGGGFSQVDYLPQLNNAYRQIINDLGMSGHDQQQSQPDTLGGDFSFIALGNGTTSRLATALDIILYATNDNINQIEKICSNTTIAEAVETLFPYFYHILTGQADTANITPSLKPTLYV